MRNQCLEHQAEVQEMKPVCYYYWHYQVLSIQSNKKLSYDYDINNYIPFQCDSGQKYLQTLLQDDHLCVD